MKLGWLGGSAPGVALMLAACGRTVVFDRLAGPGLPVLQSRLI
jgi:hypothetical protein